MKSQRIHIPLLLAVACLISFFTVAGLLRLKIDTDVTKLLPAHDRVIADALDIFRNHPIHDQVAIDIMIDKNDPDILVDCSRILREKMRASGLFSEIGIGNIIGLIPEVQQEAVRHLPLLFSRQELEDAVAPRLEGSAIRRHLQETVTNIAGLTGIGRIATIARDPLGLSDLVLARLGNLAPSHKARIYKGCLISKDGRHLLLIARPLKAGSNTAAARRIAALFATAGNELNRRFAAKGIHVVLTPTGTYQAALDNERIIRHDVKLALGLSTAGIALLLLLAFPRPLLGLLSLIPPLAGIATALFVYSLFHSSISIMVLGFSGALISIMDDFSITYLLFFDRPQVTEGKQAAREVQSIGGIIAVVTTIASFIVLGLCDFPIFAQLGEFTALGLAFTYLFIILICPRIMPVMPPSKRDNPPLHRFSTWLFGAGKPGLVCALLLAAGLVFFAKPHFHLSLAAMNTISQKTKLQGERFTRVWGDIGRKVYLMTTASSRSSLQQQNDAILEKMDHDAKAERMEKVFNPSMIFPGRGLSAQNHAAWKAFWTPERVRQVSKDLERDGAALGFKADAFAPFLTLINPKATIRPAPLLPRYDKLFNIVARPDGKLVQFITITPGKHYNAARFLNEYQDYGRIFDAGYFSSRLSHILFSTFTASLAAMSVVVAVLLFVYFLDWRLTGITLLPLAFAYICTLGTLNLIGHPLDIPGLMLTVVILGIGVDYTIYTVRGRQRYGKISHPSYVLVRSTVLLSAASTLIGFGVLCFAEHATLKSVGITSLCGIGYSFLGTILIVPPLLEATFRQDREHSTVSDDPEKRILRRYRRLGAYSKMFARFKLRSDPLFGELSHLIGQRKETRKILDIGCGYGLPACWCLEHLPQAYAYGIDPDPERVRIAGLAAGDRGTFLEGAAPGLPDLQERFDLVMLLDMLHYLDKPQLQDTLARCRELLAPGGLVIARSVTRPAANRSWYWPVEDRRARLAGVVPTYRTAENLSRLMAEIGFEILEAKAAVNPELFWVVGRYGKVE